MCWPLRAPRFPPPRLEPPRDALNERPSGGRAENGRGFAGYTRVVVDAVEAGRTAELDEVEAGRAEYERADELEAGRDP